jgi:hypothetical protein
MNVTITGREWAELEASRALPREQRMDVVRRVYAPKPEPWWMPFITPSLTHVLWAIAFGLVAIAVLMAV